jgi:multicomponent Na+:H+ antiporter subunit D
VILQLELLLFSALAFAWLKLTHLYPPELRSVNLDADWLLRRLGRQAAERSLRLAGSGWSRVLLALDRAAGVAQHRLAIGALARAWSIDTAALLVGVLLIGYLVLQAVTAS